MTSTLSGKTSTELVQLRSPEAGPYLVDNTPHAKRVGFAHWVNIAMRDVIDDFISRELADTQSIVYVDLIADKTETIGLNFRFFEAEENICSVTFEYLSPEEMNKPQPVVVFDDNLHFYFLRVKTSAPDRTGRDFVAAFPGYTPNLAVADLAKFICNQSLFSFIREEMDA